MNGGVLYCFREKNSRWEDGPVVGRRADIGWMS